jgi:hypothetical protein
MGKKSQESSSERGYQLPETSPFLGEEQFADVALAWHEGGIEVVIQVHQKFEGASYPKFEEGDAIELFIDTRDLKEAWVSNPFLPPFSNSSSRSSRSSRFGAHPFSQ